MSSFLIHRGGKLHAFAAVCDSGPQEQCSQVLLYRARADVELFCDFLVAAPLHQQVENLLVSASYFDPGKIHHRFSSAGENLHVIKFRAVSPKLSRCFAKLSPWDANG
jgi:hypothetical protein